MKIAVALAAGEPPIGTIDTNDPSYVLTVQGYGARDNTKGARPIEEQITSLDVGPLSVDQALKLQRKRVIMFVIDEGD